MSSKIPVLYYTTANKPEEEAFETWRHLMAPMYDVRPRSRDERHPGGSTIAYLLGDILANRTFFTKQHVIRDRRLVETTPDHILFQLWRTGGYTGEIVGRPIVFGPGSVALSDRRRVLDVCFAPSDTLGFVVPRGMLAGIDLETLGLRLDRTRNRLLEARIKALYRQLPQTERADVPALTAELLGFLRRLMDPSKARDVLEGAELEQGFRAITGRYIANNLGSPLISPETIAADAGISRSTLYRVFQPLGGVRHVIHQERLQAIHNALSDPLETRTLTRLSAEHGVSSLAHLSRTFRARYGMSPRAWREACRARAVADSQKSLEPFWNWFNNLGQTGLSGDGARPAASAPVSPPPSSPA